MKRIIYLIICVGIFALLWGEKPATHISKQIPTNLLRLLIIDEHTKWDENQISTWHGNHGDWVTYHATGDPGLEWPKGSGQTAVFQSGIWVACGKVKPPGGDWIEEIRTAASEYQSEYVSGTIDGEGGHIYEIHRRELDAFLNNDFESYSRMSEDLPITSAGQRILSTVQFPTSDFENWPAVHGAPWIDANGDGVYNIRDGDHPDILGDQFHWYVMNDADSSQHRFVWGTLPLNIEVQTSIFGFNRSGPLGNTLFIRAVLINKGNNELDSMFVSFWRDDDIGGSTDDLVGCDTELSLGFSYNDADGDDIYGLEVPAVGGDLFQGPLVFSPGNVAKVFTWSLENGYHLKEVPDHKLLRMTSFVKYTSGNPIYVDPNTAEEAYRYMNGLIGITGSPYIDPIRGKPSKFVNTGDPVLRTGWIDGVYTPPGDRRLLLSSGPFYLAPGDTQEVVGCIIVAGGSSWDRSITKLKYFDKFAQAVFNAGFGICSPSTPQVSIAQMDTTIVLTFQDGSDSVENYTCGPYEFEGYNVYQGESLNGPWHRIATYDKVNGIKVIIDQILDEDTGELIEIPSQFGTDSGLERYIEISYDEINGRNLINHRKYYYSVNTYAYAPYTAQRVIESPFNPIMAIPGPPGFSAQLDSESGDTLEVIHTSGISDAQINPQVIDPYRLTEDTYEVTFFEAGETEEEFINTAEHGSWYLIDDTSQGGNVREISGITEGIDNSFSMVIDIILYEDQRINQDTLEISSQVLGDTLIVTYIIRSDTLQYSFFYQSGPIDINYTDESGRVFCSSSPGSSVSVRRNYYGQDIELPIRLSGTLYGKEESNFDFMIFDASIHRDNISGTFIVSHLDYEDEPLQPYWRLMNKTKDEIRVVSHTDILSGNELTIIDGFKLTVTNGSFDSPIRSQSWEQTVDVDEDTLTRIFYLGELSTWSDFLLSNGLSGGTQDEIDLQKDIRLVFSETPQKGYYWDGATETIELRDVPFEVWTVEDSTRINVVVWVITGGQDFISYTDDLIDPATGERIKDVGRFSNGYIVPIYEPYNTSVSYSPWGEGSESLGWMMHFDFRTTAFMAGDEVIVHFTNPIFPGIDVYTFDAEGLKTVSKKETKRQLKNVNVFPNPYFGSNPEEKSPSERFVTFTHLGAGRHIVRIFTITGDLVKKIEQTNFGENNPSNLVRWDLRNDAGNYVASGMYIAYIQSETTSGKFEKVLKLAIFQPEVRLGVD